ncbi:MAG: GNAT family N-acetyltransferase [Chloroflexota bacterium]
MPRRSRASSPFVASYRSACLRAQPAVLGAYSPVRGIGSFLSPRRAPPNPARGSLSFGRHRYRTALRRTRSPTRPMAVTIAAERPDSPDAARLVEELEAELAIHYPATSRHGFSVQRLVTDGVEFFVLRSDGEPAGCGGILFVDGELGRFGELKRMYVRPAFRGRGLGRQMLDHLATHARSRGVTLLRLETGIDSPEALGLYGAFGFQRIPHFPPYVPDPLTLCMEKRLE